MHPEGKRILITELRRWLPTLRDEHAELIASAVDHLRALPDAERDALLTDMGDAWLRARIKTEGAP
jgi:hypothetical protein